MIMQDFREQYITTTNVEYINQIRIHRVDILDREN